MGDGGGEVLPTIASACIARSATHPVPADWTGRPSRRRSASTGAAGKSNCCIGRWRSRHPTTGVFRAGGRALSARSPQPLADALRRIGAVGLEGGRRHSLGAAGQSCRAATCIPPKPTCCFPGGTPGVGALLAHYRPDKHALEVRGELPAPLASLLDDCLPPGGCLLALTSVPWREAWKYGERAYRLLPA